MKRECKIGSWCQLGHPASAEILAAAGFDFVTLDLEHGEAQEADIGNFCRALQAYSCQALIRVRENQPLAIRRALDLGASGVIVPLIDHAEAAAAAVAAATYPPAGKRGFAWQRANQWGLNFDRSRTEFRPFVMVMCESAAALSAIDSICAVEGVDGVVIGPYDLSGSLGIPGQTGHPLVLEAMRRVAESCQKYAKLAGQHIVVPTADNIHQAIQDGYQFLALGMDTFFLQQGARQVLELLK